MRLLVCGGAGFIGSNFVRLRVRGAGDEVVVLDKLTYAGRRENLQDLERPASVRARRRSRTPTPSRTRSRACDAVVNFAAETHVDRSIAEPGRVRHHPRARHLHAARGRARERGLRYVQVSTDEVYGSIEEGSFTEESPLQPVLALQRHQGGRRPARRLLPPHVRARGADLPRLEQLRAVPVPREADPADGPQRHARRQAAGLRRRHADPQLDLRRGLRARDRPRARARRAGRGLQRRRPGRGAEHRGRPAHHRATPAPTSR